MPELKVKNEDGVWVHVRGDAGPRPTPEAVAEAVAADPTIEKLSSGPITITGSKDGNAAVQSIIDALVTLGLATDSTT